MASLIKTHRPRNVNAARAAAILYGDLGTSKAYVIGLAFALAGYSSFWLVAAVSVLIALVGLNYIVICKYFPSGGGVYASARSHSKILALIGAFFLVADYLVTAALSGLSAFFYFGVPNPEYWAIAAILFVGLINFLGPKHTGTLAIAIGFLTVTCMILLALFTIPHLPRAMHFTQPLHDSFLHNWKNFVGIIVALSGIETIANITGIMRLDPGASNEHPSVAKTARRAILWVIVEVSVFTALFGLAVNALPDLTIQNGKVMAPDQGDVGNAMLRYMAETFATSALGPFLGHIFGIILSFSLALLLLSAVNSAITALTALLFVISRDNEMPREFQVLNRFGVPLLPLLCAAVGPAVLLLFVHDVSGLADLYAIGFVGAIATNLGATATNKKLNIEKKDRALMLFTFIIMALVEVTLFIDKPHARHFAIAILLCGLLLRSFALERGRALHVKQKEKVREKPIIAPQEHEGAVLCAVSHSGKTLNFAMQECRHHRLPLYVLFIREQEVITEEDLLRSWIQDAYANRLHEHIMGNADGLEVYFLYEVSDSVPSTIIKTASKYNISRLVLGMSRQNPLFRMVRQDIIQEVHQELPNEVEMVIMC